MPTVLLDRYEVLGQLGRGGLGTVLRVHDRQRDIEVALKALRIDRPIAFEAFRAEFRALSRVCHPNLVSVHDFGRLQIDGGIRAYYTADLVRGEALDRFAAHHSWDEVRRALGGALRGLGLLHRAGLRHGDFKPANLLVDPSGHATLIDLGAASVPAAGTVSGTRGYIAPELLEGRSGDQRADLYAVGVTLRELQAICDVPVDVARLVTRLLDPDPNRRPADVADVLAALGEEDDRLQVIPPPEHSLVGRGEVTDTAKRLVEELLDARPGHRVLVIHGPEGSGRSRALEECKWLAQLELRVIEGDRTAPHAVDAMLCRATGEASLASGLAGAIHAYQQLAAGAEPSVLVLDDADLLDSDQARLLWTLARSIKAEDQLGLVVTVHQLGAELPDEARTIELVPLTHAEVRSWVGARASERLVTDLISTSGGWPGEIAGLLARVRSGGEDLVAIAGQSPGSAARFGEIQRLSLGARRGLALCAASGGTVEFGSAREAGIEQSAVVELQAAGWLLREGTGLRLVRMTDLTRLGRVLEPEHLRSMHRMLAERLDPAPSEHQGERILHWALAGDAERAEALLRECRDRYAAEPGHLLRAAEAVLSVRPSNEALLLTAELCELAGDPQRGLELAEQCLAQHPSSGESLRAEIRAGSSALRLGNADASLARLRKAEALAGTAVQRAEIAELTCRALIQSGDYASARSLATEALAWTSEASCLALLHEDLGVASSFLGRDQDARTHLARAQQAAEASASARALVRIAGCQAIHEFRTGHFEAAERHHRAALDIAERQGLLDQAASCSVNLGGVLHRRGDWGGALECYEKGLVLARAIAKVRTRVTLHYNLAQLYGEIGHLDRAEVELGRARSGAEAGRLSFLAALCTMLEGELALVRGNTSAAHERLTLARESLERHGTDREIADVELALVEVALSQHDLDAVGTRLEAARARASASSAEDLHSRWLLLDARRCLLQDAVPAALVQLEAAERRAAETAEYDLWAEVEAWMAIALDRQGAKLAASRHRDLALERWERCATTLPQALRDGYWRHPRRSVLGGSPVAPALPANDVPRPSARESQLERLLGIYRRLSSSIKVREVLDTAMDAAIDLTGAERGFVIVGREGASGQGRQRGLRVAVARSLDREQVGRSALKISRSIAERVMSTGEPLLTAEADTDQRFSTKESVVALALKSVACVPIPGTSGVIGALYLDNRFQRGRFTQADLSLLMAFADQVGIALAKARLYDELEARTRELEKERARIAGLLTERSKEVDRLSEQIRVARQRVDSPEEFAGIVGRSAAMQRLFTTLERVAASPLTVLIQGESGTGKELVARAIHEKGPRARSAFVSVNCAAVPEALLESELFGHVRGAFTGADRDRVGLLAHAGDGSVLLDEIGELPLAMQAKLLRVLQEREVLPLGATRPVPLAARVLSATNRRLRDEVAAGRFREDLYYRLAVVEIVLPPLRERLEDLPLLTTRLLDRLARADNRKPPALSAAALHKLMGASWPGNIRQLENVLSQALLFCSGDVIGPDDLALPAPGVEHQPRGHRHFEMAEAAEIAAALAATRYNAAEVSRRLGIPRTSLYRKIKVYGLERQRR